MFSDITIKISGEAGQGVQTVGFILSLIFKRSGFYVFANQDYMSRIRGGNNFFQLRVSRTPVYTLKRNSDIVVALDKSSVPIHEQFLNKNGLMIADSKKSNIAANCKLVDVPMHEMAKNIGGEIFVNSVACGIVGSITGIERNMIMDVIRYSFFGKDEKTVAKNIEAANAGYIFSEENIKEKQFKISHADKKETLFINGNEAIALAAVRSGCKFYSAYPMTPSTSIMDGVAKYAKQYNIIVEQAEDEIAAINMAIGASFAGARSMTATSGGGFCLMTEGVSLAAMTETPIVIVDAQRPAPATGFPTRTEQADLLFVLSSGHGEFAKAIFSPGTPEEAFFTTAHAFNLAEKYQIPVFVMTDQHLADSYRTVDCFDQSIAKVERFIVPKDLSAKISGYKRYELNSSGISPRAIPSWIDDVIYADSDEHTEEGHITEDASVRVKMVEKRMHKKMEGLVKEVIRPVTFNVEAAKTFLIGFGSTYGVIREACEIYPETLGCVHFPQVWPLPEDLSFLFNGRKLISVENNATGQFAKLIKMQTRIDVSASILKFDGRPFDLDYLIERLKDLKVVE